MDSFGIFGVSMLDAFQHFGTPPFSLSKRIPGRTISTFFLWFFLLTQTFLIFSFCRGCLKSENVSFSMTDSFEYTNTAAMPTASFWRHNRKRLAKRCTDQEAAQKQRKGHGKKVSSLFWWQLAFCKETGPHFVAFFFFFYSRWSIRVAWIFRGRIGFHICCWTPFFYI